MMWFIFPLFKKKWNFSNFTSLAVFSAVMICSLWTYHAHAFSWKTTIMNQKTGLPYASMFDLHYMVYDSSKSCLLVYEKYSNVDLSQTAGALSTIIFNPKLSVPGVISSSRLTPPDPGLTLSTAFNSNVLAVIRNVGTPGCATGYKTSVKNEYRILKIMIVPIRTGIGTTLTTDFRIDPLTQSPLPITPMPTTVTISDGC